MALYLNGAWSSEVKCKNGCSNNSCYVPAFCDSQQTLLNDKKNTNSGKISFSSQDARPKAQFIFPVIGGAIIFGSAVIAEYSATIGAVLVISTIIGGVTYVIIEYSDDVYDYIFPNNHWDETYDHAALQRHAEEFGVSLEEYKRICETGANSPLSIKGFQPINNRWIIIDIITGAIIVTEKDGGIVTCFKRNFTPNKTIEEYIFDAIEYFKDRIAVNEVLPIAEFPQCIQTN